MSTFVYGVALNFEAQKILKSIKQLCRLLFILFTCFHT